MAGIELRVGCTELMVKLGGTRVGWIESTVCLAGTELRVGWIEVEGTVGWTWDEGGVD